IIKTRLSSDVDAAIDNAEQITIAGADRVTVTISGDMTAVNTVNDGTDDYTLDKTSTPNTASITYTAAQIIALNAAADFGDDDENLDIDLTFTVDGTTILNTRSFTATIDVNFEEASQTDEALLSGQAAGEWNMNGWQGTLPYMWASSTASEDTFIKIFNNSTLDADVSVDVNSDDGTVTATVTLAQIPAGTVGIYWANDIATDAGITVPGAFAGIFTVNAPTNSVTAMANQKRAGGVDRVIPVYHDATNYKSY
ncbi:hypothetical protein KAR10_09315, partial [bacterium]|nr:hypothetical protein [bacterium]